MDDNSDSFTYSGVLILFVKTSRVHFDVFLLMRFVRADIYMLARAIVAVVDTRFGYRLALSMFGSPFEPPAGECLGTQVLWGQHVQTCVDLE